MSRFERELRAAVRPRAAAELLAEGVTRHVLDGSRWRRTCRGFYVPAPDVPTNPTQRIVEAAAGLPSGSVLTGWAAAFAWGADLLDGLDDHTMRPRPVDVCLPPGQHRASTPGVAYLQQQLAEDEVAMRGGITFTTALRTAADLAHRAGDLTEAVVGLDAMLAVGLLAGSRPAPMPGRRGAEQARRAVQLARRGVRSTWETRLRLLYVLELGFPAPLVNRAVFDLDGRFLGMPDLLDVEAGVALEYDGSRWAGSPVLGGHRNRDQHRSDNVREELFERAGLIVVRADSGDLRQHRPQLRTRLAAARADGLQRNRRRDRWAIGPPSSSQSRSMAPDERDWLLLERPRLSS